MEIGVKDEITGLMNVTEFISLAQAMFKVHEKDENIVFLYLDVEDFRSLNQKFGFHGGNQFLRVIAQILKEMYPEALVSRINGDHFVVAIVDPGDIEERTKKLIESLRTMQRDISIEMKAGIYVSKTDFDDASICMDRARVACDSIKGKYDRCIKYCDDSLDEKIRFRNYIVRTFQKAKREHYIEVHYQPEVRVSTEKICGYEALVRWRDPEYGMLSPGLFIEILEDANLIHQLDLYVVEQVCKDLAYVLQHGDELKAVSVSTNLSREDFQMEDMFERVESLRQKYGVPMELLHIEVTESALESSDEVMQAQVAKFQSAGYEVWMDDFGSGYSSLNNLKDYQFDFLKIDMNFLKEFETKPRSRTILSAIVNLAKDLHMHTLAEGVETREQFEFLKSIGCEKVQGWLFGKAEPFWVDGKVQPSGNAFEEAEEKIYFNQIGRVNVLSANPLVHEEQEICVQNQQCVAIVECDEAHIKYHYANAAYQDFLKSIGYKDMEQAVAHLDRNFANSRGDRAFLAPFLKRCARSLKEESLDCVINGNLCNLKARCIASRKEGGVSAFVIVATNLSQYEYVRRAENMNIAIRQLLEVFISIDVFSDDGSFHNVYTDYMQRQLFDSTGVGRVKDLENFAENCIHPDDRKDFVEFFNLSTMEERARDAFKDHITGLYRTLRADGKTYVPLLYMVIPFRMNGKQRYLSCVRHPDGLQGELKSCYEKLFKKWEKKSGVNK